MSVWCTFVRSVGRPEEEGKGGKGRVVCVGFKGVFFFWWYYVAVSRLMIGFFSTLWSLGRGTCRDTEKRLFDPFRPGVNNAR